MTREDWRELVFWMSATGAMLTAVLICFVASGFVVRLVEMIG